MNSTTPRRTGPIRVLVTRAATLEWRRRTGGRLQDRPSGPSTDGRSTIGRPANSPRSAGMRTGVAAVFLAATVLAHGVALVAPSVAQATTEDGGGPAPGPTGDAEGAGVEGSVRGSFRTAVDLDVPAFHGLEPSLAISYDSAASNGWLGVGWNLSGLSFVRRASADNGTPSYDDTDTFTLDGERLIPCVTGTASPSCEYPAPGGLRGYATKVESFRRIAFDPAADAWAVWDTDGTKSTYTTHVTTPAGTLDWHLSSVTDTSGNVVEYHYAADTQNDGSVLDVQPFEIRYNGTTVRFLWEDRPDAQSAANGSSLTFTRLRMKTVDISIAGKRVRAYALRYAIRPGTGRSMLAEVQQYGADAMLDSAGVVAGGTALPPVRLQGPEGGSVGEFTARPPSDISWGPQWPQPATSGFQADHSIESNLFNVPWSQPRITPGDFNGDGRTDFLMVYILDWSGHIDGYPPVFNVRAAIANADGTYQYTTILDGDGNTLPQRDTGWEARRALQLRLFRTLVGDVTGDGLDDVVVVKPHVNPSDCAKCLGGVQVRTAVSKGDGDFRLPPADYIGYFPVFNPRARWFIGDATGDGIGDLMVASQSTSGNHAMLGVGVQDGSGAMADFAVHETPWSYERWDDPHWFVGDHNADGRADFMRIVNHGPETGKQFPHPAFQVALSGQNGSLELLPTFETSVPWTTYRAPSPEMYDTVGTDLAQAGDFNGDGRTEFALMRDLRDPGAATGRIGISTAFVTGPGEFDVRPFHDTGQSSRLLNYVEYGCEGDGCRRGGRFPNDWLTGDFNGDGATDLAVAWPSVYQWPDTTRVTRLVSNRSGGYQASTEATDWFHDCFGQPNAGEQDSPCINDSLTFTFAGDLNGDGRSEVMYAGYRKDRFNKETVHLRARFSPAGGLDTHNWRSADVDGNGLPDLVYVYPLNPGVRVHTLLRQPDGSYVHRTGDGLPHLMNPVARAWKVGDVNGDGKADLMQVVHSQPRGVGPEFEHEQRVESLLSNGDGSWTAGCYHPQADECSNWPWRGFSDAVNWIAMDATGDGKTDLVHLGARNPGLDVFTLVRRDDGSWKELYTQPWPDFQPGGIRNWRPADVDADGKTDLTHVSWSPQGGLGVATLLSELSGMTGSWQRRWAPVGAFPSRDTAAWRVMRVNADGNADLVHLTVPLLSGEVVVRTLVGMGNGSWTQVGHSVASDHGSFAPPGPGALADRLSWREADLNGDGATDLIHAYQRDAKTYLSSLVSRSDGSWDPKLSSSPTSAPSALAWVGVDENGDTKDDLRRVDHTGSTLRVTSLVSTAPLDLLTKLTGSSGATTSVGYEPSSTWPVNVGGQCRLPLGMVFQTLAAVTVNDGRGVEERQDHRYRCARWSRSERRLLGFESVDVAHPAVANRAASSVRTEYQMTEEGVVRPAKTARSSVDGLALDTVELTYEPLAAAPPYRSLLSTRREVSCDEGCAARTTAYTNDRFGNVVRRHEKGADRADDQERITDTEYRQAFGPYIVALPGQVEVTEHGAGGAGRLLSRTRYCYDGDDPNACSRPPSRGLATAIRAYDDQRDRYVTTTAEYDQFGNQTRQVDALGHATTTRYDAERHVYPVETCDVLSDALSHCSGRVWDMVLGTVTSQTDVNGSRSEFGYDALGRPIRSAGPGGAVERRSYLDWGDPQRQRVRSLAEDGSAEGLWEEERLDGLGRTYRIVRKGPESGRDSVREVTYSDASSRPHKATRWFTGSGPQRVEEYSYDGRGRPVRQTHPDGTTVGWSYRSDADGSWTSSTDERGSVRTVGIDAFGRQAVVIERAAGAELRTHHTYDGNDRLIRTEDAAGNVATIRWDSLGRKVAHDDPDLGTWSYGYDDNGRLTSQTDARGITSSYDHDAFGRQVRRSSPSGVVEWRYDEPGHGAGLGRLTTVLDPSGAGCPNGRSERFTYDARGHVLEHSKCVLGDTKQLKFAYDQLGRQLSITYPDGEVLRHEYDAAGRLAKLSDYADRLTYGAGDGPTGMELSNGTREAYSYHATRGWLSGIEVTKGTTRLYNVAYDEYEPNGLPRRTTSSTNASNLLFGYDELNRLTSVSGDQNETFRYNGIGNMTHKSTVGDYAYPSSRPANCVGAQGCAGPHAVVKAGDQTLEYDANGNLTLRTSADVQQRITWNAENLPERFDNGRGQPVVARYDAAGSRVVKQVGSATSVFWGRYVEQSPDKRLIKYYFAGDKLVAKRVAKAKTDDKEKPKKDGKDKADEVFWYHTDKLSSTRAITDESGAVTARRDYAPFGESTAGPERNKDTEPIGFTGHYGDDDTGLIYMNARYYDPRLGRFISADSIVPDELNPQALNRYSYVYNTPTNYTDPSGHVPVSQEELDCKCFIEEITVGGPAEQPSEPDGLYADVPYDLPHLATSVNSCPVSSCLSTQHSTEAETSQRAELLREYQQYVAAHGQVPYQWFLVERSARQVNSFWKWLNQFGRYTGPGSAPQNTASAAPQGKSRGAPYSERPLPLFFKPGDGYMPRDAYGRPTGISIFLTPSMLGTGTRANTDIRPPGFAGGSFGQARGHLWARALGGSGDDARNLVTLLQYPANSPHMSAFEGAVRTALQRGESVFYTVTPVYNGSEPVPIGIRMYAYGSEGFRLEALIINRGP